MSIHAHSTHLADATRATSLSTDFQATSVTSIDRASSLSCITPRSRSRRVASTVLG